MRVKLSTGVVATCLTWLLSPLAAAQTFEARAVITAPHRAILSGELAARVASLPFKVGERFSKGDVVVGLDCALYEAQKSRVAAEVRAARIKRDNTRELSALNSIGEMDVALAQSEYAQALAELKIADLNTDRCEIRAPWDGRVVSVLTRAHENIRQQQELIEVVADQQLEAEVVVPAAWLTWLEAGMSVHFSIDEPPVSAEGVIAAVSPAIDAVSQTVLLRVSLQNNPNLIPGMSATAVFAAPVSQ